MHLFTGIKLEKKLLKKGAIPSIFSFSKYEKQSKSRRPLHYEAHCAKKDLLRPSTGNMVFELISL